MDFARIEEGIVTNIIVVSMEDCLNSEGVFSETVGSSFCDALIPGNWIQSGYSQSTRKNVAYIGCVYDEEKDAFIYEQPYPSWVLNSVSCQWEAPVEYPTDDPDTPYEWNEELITGS